jgi:hypothetical protein
MFAVNGLEAVSPIVYPFGNDTQARVEPFVCKTLSSLSS